MARFGILDAVLTWCRRDPSRLTDQDLPELRLHVGGVDWSKPGWNHHLSWADSVVERGDRIELRVTDGRRIDSPSAERWYRIVERITPPPRGDAARIDVKGAVLWRAPDGIYLEATDRSRGGPTLLSRREAQRLAAVLVKIALGGPPSRRKNTRTRRRAKASSTKGRRARR